MNSDQLKIGSLYTSLLKIDKYVILVYKGSYDIIGHSFYCLTEQKNFNYSEYGIRFIEPLVE